VRNPRLANFWIPAKICENGKNSDRSRKGEPMFKRHTFWLKTAVTFMFLTAAIHATSLFVKPEPKNETERQLLDLMANYRLDLMGFHRTSSELVAALSSCFSLLCLLGGLTNAYMLRKKVAGDLLKGFVGLNLLVFGPCFVIMLLLTFPPPFILTGLVAISLTLTYFTVPKGPVPES